MPYINQTKRTNADQIVDQMVKMCVKADGELNYLLYKFCKEAITPSYNNYKNYIAELRQCATEIERRMLAEYEDEKIKENGDV